jgi:uncharacterized protein involved in exopolysaccharide biosynthesis
LRYTESYLLRLGELGDRLDIAIDKKTGIVTVSAKMPDPVAAADLVRVSSRSLMQAVIGIEAKKATEQLKFAEEQQLLAKQRFEIAQSALARFSARNRGGVDPTLMVESRRLEAEVAFATTLFEQLSREVEQARLRRSQDTPVFTVIQTVSVPPRKSEPRRAIILLLCVATAAAVGVLFSAARPSVNLNVG